MKKSLILLLFFNTIFCFSQDKILFSYDTAGNQIQRELCINCLTGKKVRDAKEITKEDLITSEVSDQISYYPNPVKQELYLGWNLINDNVVSSIHVYSLTGQVLQSFNNTEKIHLQTISFENYPRGVYAVILYYKNGEQKSIKIIKQ